jgi:hypothetical protein
LFNQLLLDAPASLFVPGSARQALAATPRGAQVLADVFVVFGQAFHGIGAAAGGKQLPERDSLWPISGAA